jgi:glycosyltransferase involved in cell wall biosynthesis
MAEIHRHGIESRVLVLGFQPDVFSLEKAADVVVLCSEREPLGTVVLESMALGRPIIVAASGGLPEMIQDGETGLHCRPGDSISLRDQLSKMLRDRELALQLGSNARLKALERFSLRPHGNALMALYAEIVENGRI